MKKFPNLVFACSGKSDGNMSFRWGGQKEVLRNRKKFLGKLGIRYEDTAAMSLQHKTGISFADERSRGGEVAAADCLMTKTSNIFLFVLTGDCLPVIFYDAGQKILALAHLSRINTQEHFAEKIIKRFEKEGSRPKDIIIAIGPGVRARSYAFTAEELAERTAGHDGWKNFLVNLPNGKTGIDLVGYTVYQLVSRGVVRENIEIADIDTITNKNFFSHYRAMRTGEKEGRMATVVGITK